VTIFGRDLHLVMKADINPQRLQDDLEAKGCRLAGIERIEPSLEDVFVALTRAQAAA
jgi:hypothetical protein